MELLAVVELRDRRGNLVQLVTTQDLELPRSNCICLCVSLCAFSCGTENHSWYRSSRLCVFNGGGLILWRSPVNHARYNGRVQVAHVQRMQRPSVVPGARLMGLRYQVIARLQCMP